MPIAAPQNFRYNQNSQTLEWDPVPEALEYLILYKPDAPNKNWGAAYCGGNDTSCPFDPPSGTYNCQGQTSSSKGEWGDKGAIETITVGQV